MQRLSINCRNPESSVIERAVGVLRSGGTVVFPTDTFYGCACDPTSRTALEALFRLKGRPAEQRLPFIAADTTQASALVTISGGLAGILAERFWPGPLSLVLPLARPETLASWSWGVSLAIRVPASPAARELARRFGLPIPATSANHTGGAPSARAGDLDPELAAGLDLLLDGGPLPGGLPSTLLDLTSRPPRLLRSGAVSWELLRALPGLSDLAPLPR
jgi:L-threonylcarbamoyladenylate synthase